MAQRKRPALSEGPLDPLPTLWDTHLKLAVALNDSSRFFHNAHSFTPRIFIRNNLWRIPEKEDPVAIAEWTWRGLYSQHLIHTRNLIMSDALIEKLGLKHPYPSSPTRNPTIGLKFYRDGKFVAHHAFCAVYAAKRFLDLVIDNHPVKWASDNEIEVFGPVAIEVRGEHGTDLDKIMEHVDNKNEAQWIMMPPYTGFARNIRRLSQIEPREPAAPVAPAPTERPKPQPKPVKRKTATDDSMITIGMIADELQIAPRIARGILRTLNTPKPASGSWEWTADEADAIRNLIKENLK